MKVYVCVKQVPDTETKIKLRSDNSSIDDAGVKWVMNPYDEYAVEEAIKLKEKNPAVMITAVSVGPKRVIEAVRTALAMGADEGLAVFAPENLDANLTSLALAKAIQQNGGADLVFSGKLAIDDNASSVSQMLAENLKFPHASVVSKFTAEGSTYVVERETEGGAREVIQLQGPSVIAANKGLNQPRYPSLPGIMKAKKKPLKEIEMSSLGLSESQQKTKFADFKLPPEKPPVKLLSGDASQQASSLAKLLREEAKVI